MRILVLPPKGATFTEQSPWNALLEGMRTSGHEAVYGSWSTTPCDSIVSLNHQGIVGRLQRTYRIPPSKTTLIALEPRATAPDMYTNRSLSRYGIRYAASPLWAQRLSARPFLWPQELMGETAVLPRWAYAATLINGSKRSAVRSSLYGLRRDVIQECDRRGVPLAVFGRGWDAGFSQQLFAGAKACARAALSSSLPNARESLSGLRQRPANWLGTVHNKADALALAPVSVVIENSLDYVSEKLVDAISGGAVPLYVGPPLKDFGFPPSIAIQVPPRAEEVVEHLRGLDLSRINAVINAGQKWLRTEASQEDEIHSVLANLGSDIAGQLDALDCARR